MKRLMLVIVLLAVLGAGLSPATPVTPVVAYSEASPVIVEIPFDMQGQAASARNYMFLSLNDEVFLRSDGSGVLYIENRIWNDGSLPIDSHGWCFYWGQDVYSNIFAKDELGYATVSYYKDYSYVYNQWGVCVQVPFRHAIEYGQDYWYAVSITIANHHSVENDVIDAHWMVHSSSDIQQYVAKVSWPYNHEGVVATPLPDVLEQGYARWVRSAADAPWEFVVDLSITLGDQMAVDALSQGTYPFDEQDIAWEDNPYGVNTGRSIGQWGCYLTSCTMAMNYYAKVLGFHDETDPGELNAWLAQPISPGNLAPRGYGWDQGDPFGMYSLIQSSEMDSASVDLFDSTGPVIIPGDLDELSGVSGMETHLRDGDLGVLNVTNDGYGHFVLVTGYTTQNGVETVAINDPYDSVGSTTLLSRYGNQHRGNILWFGPGDRRVRPNYVTLYANCPVELLVMDQYGRRAGYDPRTEQSYREIPGSAYVTQYGPDDVIATSEGTKILQIRSEETSEYRVSVIGTGVGSYTIDYVAELASGKTDSGSYTGTTMQGEVDTLELGYDPNVGFQRNEVFLPLVTR